MIAKSYRTSDDVGAHERSHTEAFFRKIKFWDGIATPGIADSTGLTPTGVTSGGGEADSGADGGSGSAAADGAAGSNGGSGGGESTERKGDAPPVFIMPDGLSYIHVKRNGLIFGCSTNRNVSPCTVVEVSFVLGQRHIIVNKHVMCRAFFQCHMHNPPPLSRDCANMYVCLPCCLPILSI